MTLPSLHKNYIYTIPLLALIFGFIFMFGIIKINKNSRTTDVQLNKDSTLKLDEATSITDQNTNQIQTVANQTDINQEAKQTIVSEFGITEKGKVIIANLDNMEIKLINDGQVIKTMPILTKGKPDSYYETPGGEYKIESKEVSKLSSLGNVYMPYAMQFFGNYFIHGIPYYKGGKKVSTSYSGGCIRLADEDAKTVYGFADAGSTHLFVTNNSYYTQAKDTGALDYYIQDNGGALSMTASQAIAIDLYTGEVLVEYNGNQVIPMEGGAKLLAANTSLDVVNQEKEITYNQNKIKNKDLIPLILNQSDEAALNIISKQYGINNFIKKMNEKASAIKLTNTKITEPSGLSNKTVSTVYDLAKLIKYTHDFKPFLLSITSSSSTSTLNIFAGSDDYYGGLYGFLPEQYHSVGGIFSLKVKEAIENKDILDSNNISNIYKLNANPIDRKVIIVISGSINPEGDIKLFREYLNNSATLK